MCSLKIVILQVQNATGVSANKNSALEGSLQGSAEMFRQGLRTVLGKVALKVSGMF